MLLPLILLLVRKKVKNVYINFECLVYTDKNYMKSFVITQNKKSHSKDLSRVFLIMFLVRGIVT